jgi:hypothetical protein
MSIVIDALETIVQQKGADCRHNALRRAGRQQQRTSTHAGRQLAIR